MRKGYRQQHRDMPPCRFCGSRRSDRMWYDGSDSKCRHSDACIRRMLKEEPR